MCQAGQFASHSPPCQLKVDTILHYSHVGMGERSEALAALPSLDGGDGLRLGEMPYLFLDARYEKVRIGGTVVSCSLLVAIGVQPDGRRRAEIEAREKTPILSWRFAWRETAQNRAFWRPLVQ